MFKQRAKNYKQSLTKSKRENIFSFNNLFIVYGAEIRVYSFERFKLTIMAGNNEWMVEFWLPKFLGFSNRFINSRSSRNGDDDGDGGAAVWSLLERVNYKYEYSMFLFIFLPLRPRKPGPGPNPGPPNGPGPP